MSKTIKVYFECYATNEWADTPVFALGEVNDGFVARVEELVALIKANKLDQVKESRFIDWHNGDDLRLRGDSLVVGKEFFMFTAYPKHGDYKVETMTWWLDDFRKTWIESDDGAVIYHANDTEDFEEQVAETLAERE